MADSRKLTIVWIIFFSLCIPNIDSLQPSKAKMFDHSSGHYGSEWQVGLPEGFYFFNGWRSVGDYYQILPVDLDIDQNPANYTGDIYLVSNFAGEGEWLDVIFFSIYSNFNETYTDIQVQVESNFPNHECDAPNCAYTSHGGSTTGAQLSFYWNQSAQRNSNGSMYEPPSVYWVRAVAHSESGEMLGEISRNYIFCYGMMGESGGNNLTYNHYVDIDNPDRDLLPTMCDSDDDNDGFGDEVDEFPLDSSEWVDTDGDGIGDNADLDDDNDQIDDVQENATGTDPLDPDTDDDGFGDEVDEFPLDPSEWADADGDGMGDNQDPDDDNDGVPDDIDQFPLDPSEWADADGDGMGDNQDPDDDNDSVSDLVDDFPYDPSASMDTDGDGMPDDLHSGWNSNLTIDTDDDGDGYEDADDAFPLDPSECCDFDGDGVGDNADLDADNDGWFDVGELFCGYDPLNATSTPPDSDGDGICDPLDFSSGPFSGLISAIPGGQTSVIVFLFVAATLFVTFVLKRRTTLNHRPDQKYAAQEEMWGD